MSNNKTKKLKNEIQPIFIDEIITGYRKYIKNEAEFYYLLGYFNALNYYYMHNNIYPNSNFINNLFKTQSNIQNLQKKLIKTLDKSFNEINQSNNNSYFLILNALATYLNENKLKYKFRDMLDFFKSGETNLTIRKMIV